MADPQQAPVTLDMSQMVPVGQQLPSSTAPAPAQGGDPSQGGVQLDLSKIQPIQGGEQSAQAPPPQMPSKRPDSSDSFDQAQQAGGYSEPSERSGKPVTYLMQKPDESYSDFMKRAVEHGKTVTEEQMKDEAYQPKKIVDAAVVRPVEIAGTYATVASGINESAAALEGAKNVALKWLAEQSPTFFGHEAVKETLKRYAMQGIQKAIPGVITGVAGTAAYKATSAVWDDLFGKKK